MATRILLVSLLLSFLVACDKKEDDIDPGRNYTGTLSLDYSRSFPAFTSTLSVPVEISASGVVTISQPVPHEFGGESDKLIDGDRIKIREEGHIKLSDIAPLWKKIDGIQYLECALSFTIEGQQTIWIWTGHSWEQTSQQPYSLQNPDKCPLLFRIDNAVLSESVCISQCEDCWGRNNFRWRLELQEVR